MVANPASHRRTSPSLTAANFKSFHPQLVLLLFFLSLSLSEAVAEASFLDIFFEEFIKSE